MIELGKLISHIKDTAMPRDLSNNTYFIGLEDMVPYKGNISNISNISTVRSRVFKFKNRDLLYGRLRPYLRKVAIADFDGASSSEIIILRCSDRLLPEYLLLIMMSEDFNQFINSRTKGDRPRTSFEIISQYRIDIPSVEIQKIICNRDNKLVSAISRFFELTSGLENTARIFIDTLRNKLFWDKYNDKDFIPLKQIVELIEYGTTKKSTYNKTGTPVLRIPNISDEGIITTDDIKYSNFVKKEIDRYQLRKDDILVIRSNGSISLVGQSARVSAEHEGYAFAGYLLRLRANKKVTSEYLLELIRSTPFQQLVKTAARSSTGINNLSAKRLGDFLVPVPSIEHQSKIIETIYRARRSMSWMPESINYLQSSIEVLQKTARHIWLGHATLYITDQSSRSSQYISNVNRNNSNRNTEMAGDIKSILLSRLEKVPTQATSFEKLCDGLQVDYDLLRDAVFHLLTRNSPRIEQFYDQESKSIMLRVKK